MGRKKKNKEVVTNNESIGYRGSVSITLMHGNKQIKKIKTHNAGELELFKFLVYCLGGDFYRNLVPSYLRCYDANGQEITTRVIPSTGRPSITSSSIPAFVVITFNVPSTALLQDIDIREFRLFNQDNVNNSSNPSATILLREEEGFQVTEGSSIVVAWKMSVGNAQVVNN